MFNLDKKPFERSQLRTFVKITVSTSLMILVLVLIYAVWLVVSSNRGTYNNHAEVADLNGDGYLDVILHNVKGNSDDTAVSQTTLWLNQGEGQFSPSKIDFPAYAAGDVDGDGDADLLGLAPPGLALYLNQGGIQGGEAGSFSLSQIIHPTGDIGALDSLFVGDLNLDSIPDSLVAGCCGTKGTEQDPASGSWVWINKLNTQGGAADQPTVNLDNLDSLPVQDAALGDLDGDGDLDIVAAIQAPSAGNHNSPADRVLLNDGQGNFHDSGQRLGADDSTSVALGDVDGDGDLDALVGTKNGATIWINQGGAQGGAAGSFTVSPQVISEPPTRDVFLSDLDGDSDLDALIVGEKQAAIWWNNGLGGFSRSDQRLSFSKRHALTMADFNHDGYPDIFIGAYADDYRLWLNQGDGTFRAGIPADFSG